MTVICCNSVKGREEKDGGVMLALPRTRSLECAFAVGLRTAWNSATLAGSTIAKMDDQ